MPKQREKMTEVHSCGSPPFSTCLGAVASFIISQGQKCHKKPFPLVYYQSHKEKSVKGGHRPQRLPLILFFVGYNAGGENGCPSVSLLPPVLHCPFRRKKVKGGLRSPHLLFKINPVQIFQQAVRVLYQALLNRRIA